MINKIKVGINMIDGTKLIGSLMHKEYNSINEIICSIRDGEPIPVYSVTISGKVVPVAYINRDHVSMWWEV